LGLLRFGPRFHVALWIFLLIVAFGVIGPLFTDLKPNDVAGDAFEPPSSDAWLGTDYIGHDVFTNLIYGTRTSLYVGLLAGFVATIIGVVIGTVAGYRGGWLDELLMGFTNVVLTIPSFIVLLLISITLQTRTSTGVAFVIAITSWTWLARAVRAQASSVRTREHLDIARLSGARWASLIVYDVVPYMLSYIVMAFVLQVSSAVLAEALLSLLGLGPSDGVSLGIMLHWALAFEAVRTGAWWAFIPPTLFLTLIAFSLLMLQSSMDEVFNPRLRRGSIRRRRRGAPAPVASVAADLDEVPVASAPGAAGGVVAPAEPVGKVSTVRGEVLP
jgi:peptide/nickel transport system permease protein